MSLKSRLRWGGIPTLALLLFACGCEKGPSISEIEERERASRLYSNAMDDLQAGRMEAAITGFQHVVLQEPKSYSAHFQLATLLQDVRKDYISAIAHYRDYLALRPVSDKATVAQDRVKLCETLLSAEILRKAGGSASNKLTADNEKLTAARDALAAQVKKLEGELAKARRDIARLENENASKSRMLEKLASAEDGETDKAGSSIKEALAELKLGREEAERKSLRPTDAELLDEDEDEKPEDRIRNSVDIKKLKSDVARLEEEEAPPPAPPQAASGAANAKDRRGKPTLDAVMGGTAKPAKPGTRPETYTVQEGDTLYRISTRFYGSINMWRSIQNANRAVIPMDGRLRVGMVIKLP